MNKEEFNSLDLIEQLEYVNKKLSQHESLREISKNLNLSKTTIRNRFKKIDYMFNREKKQYIKEANSEYKCNTNILHPKPIENKEKASSEYNCNTNVLKLEKKEDNLDEYIYNTNIFKNEDAKEKLIDIIDDYEKIQEMLTWFNNQKNIVEIYDISIDTDKLKGNVKTTTVRLYDKVWDDFRGFMKDYPEYKSMDLISMALIEYMDKYKK